MKPYFLILVACIFFSCTQKDSAKTTTLKQASEYFPKEKAKVLVVGLFHFDYPGLDASKTSDEDKIDVLKEPKKSEVTELVNYIKKFKPTKIAIEAFPSWKATEKLEQYKEGDHRNERDERYQLGMRIATELNLDTLYAVDSESFSDDLEKLNPEYTEKMFKDFDFKSEDPYHALVFDWYKEESLLAPKTNLLEMLKLLNTREWHQYGYGGYLVGDFKLDDHRGADILSVWWYSRNLRIFRNVQKMTTDKNDRILMIFGNGHASIFRQLFESSPEYEFVEFESL